MPLPPAITYVLKSALVGVLCALVFVVMRENYSRPRHDAHPLAAYSYKQAVNKALPSVVNIYTARQVDNPNIYPHFFNEPFSLPKSHFATGSGSGVIVQSDGFILTNYHVIKNAQSVHVLLNDGRDMPAHLIGSDPDTDLAVLKIAANNLTAAQIASQSVEVGDVVLAMGNPFGVGLTVTMGIVSATGRDRLGLSAFENFIQTDAAINPGNSGGALVNAKGELVGINTAIFSQDGGSQGIGFSIPAATALEVFSQLGNHGKVIRGWIGAAGRDLPAAFLARLQIPAGAMLESIAKGGPADSAGLLVGDIITALNGKPIQDVYDILKQVSSTAPGLPIGVDFIRTQQGQALHLHCELIIGERPQFN